MIKMKALRSFGVANANEGHVSRGREFEAANESRAKDLEDGGLAYRLVAKEPASSTMEAAPPNKAAEAGPLGSRGGRTGAAAPAQSSRQDRPPRSRRSKR